MKKIHILQHVPFEGPGYFENIFQSRGYKITQTKLFEDSSLPPPEESDLVLVMGGPMGVYDESEYSWLVEEKAFLKSVIEKGKKVLGICLGAQLAAEVLGAKVVYNGDKEIGWYPVESTQSTPLFPENFTPLHWHGDTFEIPKGATNLVRSMGCENQAFVWGENQVLGLQFHLEMMPEGLEKIISNCSDHKEEGPYIQDAEKMINSKENFRPNWGIAEKMLDTFLD